MPHRRLLASLFVLPAILLAAPGCELTDIAGDDSDSDVSSSRPTGVPRGASLVESGGDELSYTATRRGTIYVVDAENERVVVSREVSRGQEVEVNVGDDQVTLGGRSIYNRNLESEHPHAIWFRPDTNTNDRYDDDEKPAAGDIPRELRNARRVESGQGSLNYNAQDDGTVYVYDRSSQEIVYQGEVERGQRLRMSADDNAITLDGQNRGAQAQRKNRLYPNHTYDIYFDAD